MSWKSYRNVYQTGLVSGKSILERKVANRFQEFHVFGWLGFLSWNHQSRRQVGQPRDLTMQFDLWSSNVAIMNGICAPSEGVINQRQLLFHPCERLTSPKEKALLESRNVAPMLPVLLYKITGKELRWAALSAEWPSPFLDTNLYALYCEQCQHLTPLIGKGPTKHLGITFPVQIEGIGY